MSHLFLSKLEKLDRRWIYLFIALSVALPLFLKFGIAPAVTPPVRAFYNAIEELPAGSLVLLSADYDPGGKAELNPMMQATLRHLCERRLRFVVITLWSTGPALVEQQVNLICRDEYGLKYGEDYCYLGQKEGREAVIVEMGRSLRSAFPLDYYHTPIERIPLMRTVENYASFALLVNISAGYPGTKEYVQYVQARFGIPIVSGASAVSVPEYSAYLQSGQLRGLLTGISGAAEYESLLKKPGLALITMGGQTTGHLIIIFFIVVGNVIFFINRRSRSA
ncbi:hypothetical protein HZB60_05830 [candidate division KSB1 bacterium]|nr:hypothetical protein [candidate division KSB1 bacterium]